MEINTGEGKSEVISPSDDVWELIDDDGAVELSFSCGCKMAYFLEYHGQTSQPWTFLINLI